MTVETRRVVITGMGIISCLGNSPREVLDALREGRSGVEAVPERKQLRFHSCLAGTVKNFSPPEMPKKNFRQMGEGGLMVAAAARQAIDDAGLTDEQIRHDRTGVLVGNAGNNWHTIVENCNRLSMQKKRLSATMAARTMASSVSANLSVLLGTQGHCMTMSCACASGATAIGYGTQLIRLGLQDRVLAGGTQEGCWEFNCLFDSMRVFAKREDRPAEASRPFDKYRDGLVPAAGAGIVVLEEYGQAKARGADVYAELIGFGTNCDGYDVYAPSGTGSIKCVELALADAGIRPDQVDYVNAHATSTPVGDVLEAQCIAQIFGNKPLVSSTKSMTGHEVGAAANNELICTLLMMHNDFVAPNINIDQIDEQCRGINLVANEAIDAKIRIAVSNSFGFGGVNACLVVKRQH